MKLNMQGTDRQADVRAHRSHRSVVKYGAAVGIASLAMLALGTVPASADTGQTSDGSTTANVEVGSAIKLTGLTSSFTLTGLPGETTTDGGGAVTYNVETNNQAGYAVTVKSDSSTMDPANGGGDTIPIADLTIRESGTTPYTPLSSTGTVTVHSQDTRSAEEGDSLSNDFQMDVPFVNADTYSATLNYVATTL